MKISVLGSTGGIGREIVSQALERGHEVMALARSPEKLSLRHACLIVRKADPTSASEISPYLAGQDAVLSALGPTGRKSGSLMRDSARAATQAMTTAGVRRILLVSASLLFAEGLPGGIFVPLVRWILRDHVRDLRGMEEVVQASGLDWTIVRPPRLTNQADSQCRARTSAFPEKGSGFLPRKAVAHFMLDSLEQKKHTGEIVGIAR